MGTAGDPLSKLQAIRRELEARLLEREEILLGALAALLAGEHLLLLGPVGTAKSLLAVEVCQRVQGAHYFGWLLTRFSTPEELFGAVSVRALQEDRYERVTDGRLPTAHIAFLDEIFKANGAILNALLTLINERLFHNGGRAVRAPLLTLFAASNELPEESELLAFYDRFLLRYNVNYIKKDDNFKALLRMEEPSPGGPRTTLSLTELHLLQEQTRRVRVPEGVLEDLVQVRSLLHAKGLVGSDRRYRRALGLLRAFALLAGRSAVTSEELLHLQHVLWSAPEEAEVVRSVLEEVLHGHDERARALLAQARDVERYALRAWGDAETAMRAGIEAHTKLNRLRSSLAALVSEAEGRQRRTSELRRMMEELEGIQRRILEEGV